jgi:DNA-binding transcriptional regulator YdaS (Cro superfamily)
MTLVFAMKTRKKRDRALERAIEKLGSSARLAARIGITEQAISQWRRVPYLRVLEIERATGIPRTELRPDIYPPELERGVA